MTGVRVSGRDQATIGCKIKDTQTEAEIHGHINKRPCTHRGLLGRDHVTISCKTRGTQMHVHMTLGMGSG